ncbi:MAG: hypothetical protein ACK502_00115 [Alphaproteobacteria bacterium]
METAPLKLTINPLPQEKPVTKVSGGDSFWGEDGFSFGDILDIVNPLQQLPVVSTLYRENTGETISTAARLAGGALLGGPIGFVASLINAIIEDASGKDIGSHVLAMLDGESDKTELASNTAPSPASVRRGQEAYLKAQSIFS